MALVATATLGKSLLSSTGHKLILIDFQSRMAIASKLIAPELPRNNAALVSRAAKSFGDPTIPTPIAEKSFSGPMFAIDCDVINPDLLAFVRA